LNEVLEEGNHFVDDNGSRHLLDKLGEVGCGLTSDHRGLIVDEQAKLLTELLLDGGRNFLVGSCEEATSGNLGCEPICFGESDCEGNKEFLDLLGRELLADLVERLDSLNCLTHAPLAKDAPASVDMHFMCLVKAYLVSNDGLLYGGEVLERGEQDVTPRRASNVFDEVAKLLAQSNQDLVLILDRLCDENVRLGLYRRIASES
jgi:hypothetical protein